MNLYTVKEGDTVAGIAETCGISPVLLSEVNGLSMRHPLVTGEDLVIPEPEEVCRVPRGDSLYTVGERYGVSVNTLLRNNPSLNGVPLLYPGQELVISYRGEKEGSIRVNGYAYPFIRRDTLRRELPYLSSLTVFTYGFTPEGKLISPEGNDLPEIAAGYGVGSLLLLSTLGEDGRFNNTLSEKLFRSPEMRETLTAALIAEAGERGYDGIEVDFEYIRREDRERYTAFLASLADALHEKGFLLYTALAPKTSADMPGLLYEGHDYAAVGGIADYVILMTYEWGYQYGPPGAVAPLPNVEAVLRYAVTEIPPEKILMGVPGYGYDWKLPYEAGVTVAEGLPVEQALSRAADTGAVIRYDDTAQAPFYTYEKEGAEHIVWFENARSIAAGLGLVTKYSLAGISVWNIMRYFPALYQLLNLTFSIRQS